MDASQPEFDWEAHLQSLEHALHPAFGLWDAAGFQLNAELPAGVGELGISVLVKRRGVFLFESKNGSAVSEELIGDAVTGEGLMEYMIVGV